MKFKAFVFSVGMLVALLNISCSHQYNPSSSSSTESTQYKDYADTTNLITVEALIPRTEYSLESSTGNGGSSYLETKAWDGYSNTFWCSPYITTKPFPQYVGIKLARSYNVSSLRYKPRQPTSSNPNPGGRVKNYEILVVKSGSTAWQTIASGTFLNSSADQTVTFSSVQTGVTMLRVKALTVWSMQYTTIAELSLYQNSGTTYVISASVDASGGGTISPSGNVSVAQGSSKTFSIVPNATYNISKVVVDNVSVGAVSSYTFSNVTAAHTIVAYFAAKPVFVINASVDETGHGTITPAGNISVTQGLSQTFSIVPDAGYSILKVVVDNVSVGAVSSYTFSNVTAAHTIVAYFAVTGNTYTISASKAGAGKGTLTPSGAVVVQEGGTVQFTITPDPGNRNTQNVVDGIVFTGNPTYTFSNVSGNHTFVAYFEPIQTYTISASKAGTGKGTLTPSGAVVVQEGGTVQFTITPDPGNKNTQNVVDGVVFAGNPTYTFSNVSGNHTFVSWFEPNQTTFTITASVDATGGGTITPSGNVSVVQGASQTFAMTPNTGYAVAKVLVDNTDVGAVTTYTFSNVVAAHTIKAYFKTNTTSPCDGVKAWSAADPWTSYKVGDRRVSANKLYQCKDVAWSYLDPAGPNGSLGWTFIANCQ